MGELLSNSLGFKYVFPGAVYNLYNYLYYVSYLLLVFICTNYFIVLSPADGSLYTLDIYKISWSQHTTLS